MRKLTLRRLQITSHNKIAQSSLTERAHLWTSRWSGDGQRIGMSRRCPSTVTPVSRVKKMFVWVLLVWHRMCKVCLVLSDLLHRETFFFLRYIAKMDNCLQGLTNLFAFLNLNFSYNRYVLWIMILRNY